MVAPHDTGDLVRSLVRVPGSGFDYQTAGSKCLDLARASSLAASVPVPATLPSALATPVVKNKEASSRTSAVKLGSQDGVTAGILPRTAGSTVTTTTTTMNKRVLDDADDTSSVEPIPKRGRIVFMTPEELSKNASRVVPLNTPAGPVLLLTAQPASEISRPIRLDQLTLSELIKEKEKLKRENAELKRRLNLFGQLFKDKKRLTSVVKRLGVGVVP